MPILKSKSVNVSTGEIDEIYFTPEEEIVFLEKRSIAEAAIFPDAQIAFVKKIDADVDAIYADAIGNRTSEYELAETEALAFKAASYSGTAPSSVQSWADAKKQTTKWAADNIIATSTGWRTAQSAIRAQRLLSKESAKIAADMAALSTVRSTWSTFVVMVRTQLGI
jgi:hypothetical protein